MSVVYRLLAYFGFAVGALLAGLLADRYGMPAAHRSDQGWLRFDRPDPDARDTGPTV